MKRLNLYYIVSIITLSFMMFILFRTLQVTGWFEDHRGKSPAERVLQTYPGNYRLNTLANKHSEKKVRVESNTKTGNEGSLLIRIDSLAAYMIEVNDFEDEQILIEIYDFDSTGTPQRLEGCELLLSEDDAENFKGSTIGDFCGFKEQSSEYLALDLLLSGPYVSLKIQTYVIDQVNNPDTQKYLLERID